MSKYFFLSILFLASILFSKCTSVKFSSSKKATFDFLNKSNQKRYNEALVYFRSEDIAIFNNPKSRVYEGGINNNLDRSTHNGTIANIAIYGGFIKNDTANILVKIKFIDGYTTDWNGKPNYFQMIKEKGKWKVLVTFPN